MRLIVLLTFPQPRASSRMSQADHSVSLVAEQLYHTLVIEF